MHTAVRHQTVIVTFKLLEHRNMKGSTLVNLLLVCVALASFGPFVGCLRLAEIDKDGEKEQRLVLDVPQLKPPADATPQEAVLITAVDAVLGTLTVLACSALGITINRNRKLKKQLDGQEKANASDTGTGSA